MNHSPRRYFIAAAIASIVIFLLGAMVGFFVGEALNEQSDETTEASSIAITMVDPSTGEESELAPEELEAMSQPAEKSVSDRDLQKLEKQILDSLRMAQFSHPVPYVSGELMTLLAKIRLGHATLSVQAHGPDSQSKVKALWRHTDDGKPLIIVYYQPVQDDLAWLEKQYDPDFDKLDVLQQDYFVALVMHEWHHGQLEHRYEGEGLTLELHLQQESEAWLVNIEKVIQPSTEAGRYTLPPSEQDFMAAHAYGAAGGDPDHPAWQAFIRWVAADGPYDDLRPYVDAHIVKSYPGE